MTFLRSALHPDEEKGNLGCTTKDSENHVLAQNAKNPLWNSTHSSATSGFLPEGTFIYLNSKTKRTIGEILTHFGSFNDAKEWSW